jgi:hypothetical protein
MREDLSCLLFEIRRCKLFTIYSTLFRLLTKRLALSFWYDFHILIRNVYFYKTIQKNK